MKNYKRSPLKPWKKGPTRGKGRPQNATCEYKGARQRTWVAEIRKPKNRTRLWLGSFATAEEVAMIRLQGDFRVQMLISIFLISKPFPIQPSVHVIHQRLQELKQNRVLSVNESNYFLFQFIFLIRNNAKRFRSQPS
ncbi:hypothetical protein FEM48_ZijujUnG0007800 [Ziziphus jujuba var. spinosa]|uniref:AP2/ERF domain-containing protein n=1 Tax=Ziziphus jujuba var. spinosa TaxID=714518 RepID=A0A978UA06_ZIZJJ|nr:hypothetical protein FEM48_ZijujUnG0007800 [Ziziphus jujuba var. spinosa]